MNCYCHLALRIPIYERGELPMAHVVRLGETKYSGGSYVVEWDGDRTVTSELQKDAARFKDHVEAGLCAVGIGDARPIKLIPKSKVLEDLSEAETNPVLDPKTEGYIGTTSESFSEIVSSQLDTSGEGNG